MGEDALDKSMDKCFVSGCSGIATVEERERENSTICPQRAERRAWENRKYRQFREALNTKLGPRKIMKQIKWV